VEDLTDIKNIWLTAGLLLLAGVPFVEHLMKVDMPDLVNGFLRGIGIGLIIAAIVMQKFTETKEFR